jgi:hypothetical protein
LVDALCYKPEGNGFDSEEVIGFFNLANSSSSSVALGSTQPLKEMSFLGVKVKPAHKLDNLTSICDNGCLENAEASRACYRDSFTFTYIIHVRLITLVYRDHCNVSFKYEFCYLHLGK